MSTMVMSNMKSAPKLLKKRQKHSRWVIGIIVCALLFVESAQHSNEYVDASMESLGAFFIAVCVMGRSYCSAFIGGIKNDMVMRDGPFSVVRNPLYVFSFIGLMGIGMLSNMLTVALGMMVMFIVYYKFVVAREEAFLLDKFGDEYLRYTQEVPRWFPKWSLWREPEQITVRPKFLRRTMMDGLIFFIALPSFEALDLLHAHHILPVLVYLP